MKIARGYKLILALFLTVILIFTGCSNTDEEADADANENTNTDEENNTTETDSDEKVKITIAYQWGEDAFNDRYKPIEDLLGNVEIEYVASDGTMNTFEEMFAAGVMPDIFVDQNIFALQDLEVIYPLDDLLEQIGFDVDIFDQPLLDSLRAYDDDGRVIGLPDGTSNIGLYYNKDVFDLFGIEYPDPEVPMTWPEVMDLARKMTGERNGVNYVGISGLDSFILDQFAPNATDPDTGEVLVNKNEAFKKYFDLVSEFYNIPGISDEEAISNTFPERRAGMALATQTALNWLAGEDDPEPIDLAPYPVWPEMPNIGPLTGTTPMVIANYSENKETALKVLEAYFDPEILLKQVRAGATAPPIDDPELQSQYAVEMEIYEGKNLDAYHVLDRATPEERVSRWDDFVDIASAEEAIREGKDVVTVLRELEEESEAKIQEEMAAK